MLPVLRSFLPAAGLALSLSKSVLVNYSTLTDDELHTIVQPILGDDSLLIADYGEYSGILIGPGSSNRYWDAPVAKFRSRCHHIRSLASLTEADTCVPAAWLYVAHLLYSAARHDNRVWDPTCFAASARAVIRSTVTWFPTAREFLVRPALHEGTT